MNAPLILIALSLTALTATLILPDLSDFVLIAGPALIASLVLLLRATRKPSRRSTPVHVIVDGSNVMYWKDKTPQLQTLILVLRDLETRGFTPGVVFDANAGYLLEGRYRHHQAFSKRLGLAEDRVMVVDKGDPADRLILTAARDMQARVVSNDRFRDWADDFPEVTTPGFLIKGGFRDGIPWLDLDAR
jgi:rRNA-processing protein FCF1